MFFLDDSLFGVVDAYNEDVGTVETSIVVVHVMDTLLEAPRLDSADPQDQAISFPGRHISPNISNAGSAALCSAQRPEI